MHVESTKDLFERLKKSKRLKEIIDELIDWHILNSNLADYERLQGLVEYQSNDNCDYKEMTFKEIAFLEVVRCLAHVPETWEMIKGELPAKRIDRRESLAKELRKTAKKLEDDPDGQNIYVCDTKSIIMSPIENNPYPTIANYLRDIALNLDGNQLDFTKEALASTRNKQHSTLKEYAPSQIKRIVHSFPLNKPSPNIEIAEIVSIVIIGLEVSPDLIQHRKI